MCAEAVMMVARSGQVWAGYCGRGACMLGTDAGDCLKLRDAGLRAILILVDREVHTLCLDDSPGSRGVYVGKCESLQPLWIAKPHKLINLHLS